MSSSGMPEIGSRISLISKADIRYEGKLFAVDPEECTIALSSVRSYGTEDRDTPYPVPAQQQVYDYILFRGSDIKDIRVLTTTIPNDPAIVQLSVPPSISDQQFQSRLAYTQPPLASMGMPNIVPGTSRQVTQSQSAFAGITNVPQSTTTAGKPVTTAVSDESRSSTPSARNANNIATKTTEVPQTSADSAKSADEQMNRRQNYGRDQQRVQGGGRFQQGGGRFQGDAGRFQGDAGRFQGDAGRFQGDAGRFQGDAGRFQGDARPQRLQQRYPQQQQQRYGQQDQSQRYGQQDQQQRYGQQGGQYRDYNRDQYRNYEFRDSYGGDRRSYTQQPLRNNMQQRDNWQSYGGQQRRINQNRTGQQTSQNQNYQNRGGVGSAVKPRNTLKFENDYDFEQANNEFEEMRSKLAKTKLDNGPKMNGDVEKKEDSGKEESGGEEPEPVVSEEVENGGNKEVFYDKVKSFFDQISYEAIERSKGLTTRVDWKTERKINSETFGQVAFRRNNMGGNYRVGPRTNMSGGGSGGYYNNNYQNRNMSGGMTNNYRQGGYNRGYQQPQQRTRQYNSTANKNQETSKETKVAA